MNNKLVVISEECWIYEAGRKAIVLAEEQGEYAMTEILFLDTMETVLTMAEDLEPLVELTADVIYYIKLNYKKIIETVNKSFDWCGFKAIK